MATMVGNESDFGKPMEELMEFGGDTPMGRPGQPAELTSIYG